MKRIVHFSSVGQWTTSADPLSNEHLMVCRTQFVETATISSFLECVYTTMGCPVIVLHEKRPRASHLHLRQNHTFRRCRRKSQLISWQFFLSIVFLYFYLTDAANVSVEGQDDERSGWSSSCTLSDRSPCSNYAQVRQRTLPQAKSQTNSEDERREEEEDVNGNNNGNNNDAEDAGNDELQAEEENVDDQANGNGDDGNQKNDKNGGGDDYYSYQDDGNNDKQEPRPGEDDFFDDRIEDDQYLNDDGKSNTVGIDDFYAFPEGPRPPTLLPLTEREVIGYAMTSMAITLGASGGIGGGGILVPIFILVIGLPLKVAVPCGAVTVLGGSMASTLVNLGRRHPLADRPVIDWDLVLVMEVSNSICSSVQCFLVAENGRYPKSHLVLCHSSL